MSYFDIDGTSTKLDEAALEGLDLLKRACRGEKLSTEEQRGANLTHKTFNAATQKINAQEKAIGNRLSAIRTATDRGVEMKVEELFQVLSKPKLIVDKS